MVGDGLGVVVVDGELRADGDPAAVLVLLSWQGDASGGPGALDAEQIVVHGREAALAPGGLLDRLGDRHRCGYAIALLGGDGAGRDLADERLLVPRPGRGVLLRGRAGGRRRRGRGRCRRGRPGWLGRRGLNVRRSGRGRRPGLRCGTRGGLAEEAGGGEDTGHCPLRRLARALVPRSGSSAGNAARPRERGRAGQAGDRGGGGSRCVRLRGSSLGVSRRRAAWLRRCLDGLAGRVARCGLKVAVVGEGDDALVRERCGRGVGVEGEAGQGVGGDGVEDAAGVAGDDRDVAVVNGPVAGPGDVAVAKRVPAPVRLRVCLHGGDLRGGRVGVHSHVRPGRQRPGIGGPPSDPAAQPGRLGGEFKGEAGERGAGGPVVGALATDLAPDQRLYLGGRLALRELEVVAGHVDDRGSQLRVAGGRLPGCTGLCCLLERELVQRHAGWRGQRRRPRGEVEPGDHAAGAHGDKRRRLLPPWLPGGAHGYPSSPSPGIAVYLLLGARLLLGR